MKHFFEFDDSGVRPIRASGTRWVTLKVNAMKRVLSKYGAYTSHLAALIEDTKTKSQDRSKLQGYLKNWLDAKYVLGCAFFTDLLQPCATFSRSMQTDDLDKKVNSIAWMSTNL